MKLYIDVHIASMKLYATSEFGFMLHLQEAFL